MNVRERVSPVTPEELDLTIAILILGNHECGGMPFKQWFKTRLHSSINMFDSIGGLNSSDVKFLPYYRFMKKKKNSSLSVSFSILSFIIYLFFL